MIYPPPPPPGGSPVLGWSVKPVHWNPLGAGRQLADTLVQLAVRFVHVVVLDYHVEVVGVLSFQPLRFFYRLL